jgi:hypothetical protein
MENGALGAPFSMACGQLHGQCRSSIETSGRTEIQRQKR